MKFFHERVVPAAIAQYVVSADPEAVLIAHGIGSCVVVALHDPEICIGGLLHAALPLSKAGGGLAPAKYVDAGFDVLLHTMIRAGVQKQRIVVQIAGGSNLLTAPGFANTLDIGRRNIAAAELVIAREGLRIAAADVGGHGGRTVRLYVGSGKMTVQTLGQDEKVLAASHASANVVPLSAALCVADHVPGPVGGILE